MHDMARESIRIGTSIRHTNVERFLPHGFESFNLNFSSDDVGHVARIAGMVMKTLEGSGIVVSALGCFGNAFATDAAGEQARRLWEELIDGAHLFGCGIVAGFTGKLSGESLDANLERFREVFAPLCERARARGVRIALENCGKPHAANIAYNPDLWERMFELVPAENLGLQWEPAHQLRQLIDPIPQLREWATRVFHVHGKDGTIMWDVVRKHGIQSELPFVVDRTPGFGESNWTEIISILREKGYRGSIDIEGYHDPVYRDELEMTGQVHALNYLRQCRGGYFVP